MAANDWGRGREPIFQVVEDTDELLLIQDVGPWDQHLTITNGVEMVVEELAPRLNGRRLEYIDSDGSRDVILYSGSEFKGFAPGLRSENKGGPDADRDA